MNEIIKRLKVIQNSCEAVAHNSEFKNHDPVAQKKGELAIFGRFAEEIEAVIKLAKDRCADLGTHVEDK